MSDHSAWRPADGVKAERTGWRDNSLSARHRTVWGFDCPAVDLDWWVVEYDSGLPVLVIDYKNWRAPWPPARDMNAKALGALCLPGGRPIPMMFVRYRKDPWEFVVMAGNAWADEHFPRFRSGWVMSERLYVRWLYRARGRDVPLHVGERLSEALPRGVVAGPISEAA